MRGFGGQFADGVDLVRQLRAELPPFEQSVAAVHTEADQVLDVALWPHATTGERLRVPLRCDGLHVTSPVLFVHDLHVDENDDFDELWPLGDEAVRQRIAAAWDAAQAGRLAVAGQPVDLVRSGPTPQPADVLAVHELTISGRHDGSGFRAVIDEAKVALAAVRELVPRASDLTRVAYTLDFLRDGTADHVALRLPDAIEVDFRQAADKAGGLISPVFKADVLSRLDGPVDGRALPGFLAGPPDLAAAFDGATILGMPLAALVESIDLPRPLAIVATPDRGASMTWKDLRLRSSGPFVVHPGTTFELTVVRSPAETVTRCTITDFTLVLPPGLGDLVRIHFQTLRFEQRPGRPPDLDVEGLTLELGGDLGLLKTLQDAVDFGDNAPALRPLPNGLHAGYTLAIPETSAGAFVMRNIAVGVGVDVPFDGQPIVTSLSFASRQDPFNLSVSAFGGGGYLVFEIAQEGIRTLEASLDFGATVAIGVGVATAEVHALGGVQFLLQGDRVAVTGFLRVGGSVDVLGLVSVSVELRVELTYIEGVLKGRATAVIEIDVTFWSGSIELDSGEYTFAGAEASGDGRRSFAAIGPSDRPEPTLEDWRRYRERFAAL